MAIYVFKDRMSTNTDEVSKEKEHWNEATEGRELMIRDRGGSRAQDREIKGLGEKGRCSCRLLS